MQQEIVKKILEKFSQQNHTPETELTYTNHYTFLIAIALSAQSTDKQVNKVTDSLFKKISSPEDVVNMGEETLSKEISSIGLWRNKAKNIFALSKILITKFNGEVPDNFDDLISLPGIGRKSANVFLVNIYNINAMPVDTHVFRVSNRIGLTSAKNTLQTEKQLMQIIPKEYLGNAHNWLVLHGRYTCKARKPECHQCQISKYCEYFAKNKDSDHQ